MKNIIRQEVRRVLREGRTEMHPAYPTSGGANSFPNSDGSGIVKLPEDINTEENYLINWEGMSTNQDLYGFPEEEFKKGLQMEKAKNDAFNILDISKIVISRLEDDINFYSNLDSE